MVDLKSGGGNILIRNKKDTERKAIENKRHRLELTLLQAKEHLEPSEAGKNKEGFFPRVFRGNLALQTP